MKCLLSTAAALSVLLLAAGPTADDAALIAAQKPSYPLTTCVVSGKPLAAGGGMTPKDVIYEGRLVSFCCNSCPKQFEKSPAEFIKKIDEAVIAAQKANYPLDTCPISGEKLDASAKSFVVGTKLMMTCCNDCKKEVLSDPSKAMAALDAAYIATQEKDYALTTCPACDMTLGDQRVKVLYGTTLVEFCSKGCAAELTKAPQVVMAKMAAAKTAKKDAPAEPKKEAPAAPK